MERITEQELDQLRGICEEAIACDEFSGVPDPAVLTLRLLDAYEKALVTVSAAKYLIESEAQPPKPCFYCGCEQTPECCQWGQLKAALVAFDGEGKDDELHPR